MLDVDTFLTALYVMVDDFCHCRQPPRRSSKPCGGWICWLSWTIASTSQTRWPGC